MKEKYKCIYSLKLAGYLMMHGYPIRGIEKNKYNPKWDVYFSDYPNHSWMTFDIDEGIVKNAECKDGRSYFYGELRRITKQNLESA